MNKVLIIAEAGVNHNGSIEIAKKLIDKAAEAKADVIKFQTFTADSLVNKNVKKAEYQQKTGNSQESQYDMLKRLELDVDMHKELITYCNKKKIKFLSTPFDLESIDLLNDLGMDIYKIPSGEVTNYPYLKKIAKLKKTIIMSTGMCTLEEVRDALKVLKENGASDIKLLHCNTEYPTPMKDVNLKAMVTMKNEFNLEVGYSDHTKGIEVPIAAVALGATIIEKHFTLDRNMEGPDHKASLEPEELKEMVHSIRNIELALGSGEKKPSESEMKNINVVRKFIVAKENIKKGEKFTEYNITCKRIGKGISAMQWNKVINKIANKNYVKEDIIEI